MGKVRIGIDPGKASYICVIEEEGTTFYQYPLIGKETDVKGICDVFEKVVERIGEEKDVHAVIEDVHAIYGSSAHNTFSFGVIVGVLEGLLHTWKIPFTKITPKVWQKELWQGVPLQTKMSSTGRSQVNDTKAISEMAAKRLFPNLDLRDDSRKTDRVKNNDHNKVDTLLIAEYCRRKF